MMHVCLLLVDGEHWHYNNDCLITLLHRAPSPLAEEQELFFSMMSEEEQWTTHSRGTSTGDQVRPDLQIINYRLK